MAYEKQTWTCGDTITADKLNHIEDGIANGWGDTLVVTLDSDGYTDKTVKEINDAFNTGQRVVIMKPYNQLPYSMSTAEILCAVG